MKRKNSLFVTIIIAIISITLLSPLEVSAAKICALSGCNSKAASGSKYCSSHKPKPVTKKTTTYSKSTNKKTNQKSY